MVWIDLVSWFLLYVWSKYLQSVRFVRKEWKVKSIYELICDILYYRVYMIVYIKFSVEKCLFWFGSINCDACIFN